MNNINPDLIKLIKEKYVLVLRVPLHNVLSDVSSGKQTKRTGRVLRDDPTHKNRY